MFDKNSRYFRLPASSALAAGGDRLQGKNLRLIPVSPGSFLHMVQGHDRLDLLALKYYRDSTRWWQISDANSQFAFPVDLLDRAPIREEQLTLVSVEAETRFAQLIATLSLVAEVRNPLMTFSESSFVALAVTDVLRGQIIGQIRAQGFRYLRSFAWNDGMTSGQLFRFEDRTAKQNWRLLMESLKDTAGILALQSIVEDGTMWVVYNTAMLGRERILRRVAERSYAVDEQRSRTIERTGAQIVIPPNSLG